MPRTKKRYSKRIWCSVVISPDHWGWLMDRRTVLGLTLQDMLELALRIALSKDLSELEIGRRKEKGWKPTQVLDSIHAALKWVGGPPRWATIQDTICALLVIAKPIMQDRESLSAELERFTIIPVGDEHLVPQIEKIAEMMTGDEESLVELGKLTRLLPADDKFTVQLQSLRVALGDLEKWEKQDE